MFAIHEAIVALKEAFGLIKDMSFKYLIYEPLRLLTYIPLSVRQGIIIFLFIMAIILFIKMSKDTDGFKQFSEYY